MINPFVLDYQARVQAWKQCRMQIPQWGDVEALDVCVKFWQQAPLQNHLLDWDTCDSWPTPWEILKHNCYCTSTHSLMIAETLRLSDPRFKNTQLWLIKDTQACVEKIVCVWDQWVLNHGHVDKQPLHRIQHVYKQSVWQHSGKQWQLI